MPRPRKPTNVLELKGAFKKDPQRRRMDPPTCPGLGPPPSHLSKAERHIWKEIESRAPEGVLTRSDRLAAEELCSLVHEIRTNRDNVITSKRTLLRSYLAQFGMTPADRAKLGAPEPEKRNPFEDL